MQALPLAFEGLEQAPVVGLQDPGLWHWSVAGQTTGFDPTHAPCWQVDDPVQALASLHDEPFATLEKDVVLTSGWHVWQAFVGLLAPGA